MKDIDDNIEDINSNISYNSLEIGSIDLNDNSTQKIKLEKNEDLNNSFDLKSQLLGQLKIEKEETINYLFSPISERQRSQTHNIFNYKPEFVPKPKPKKTKEKVSPMKLCVKYFRNDINNNKRFTNEIISEYQNNLIDCLSCPDDDYDSFDLDNTSDCTPIEENSFVYELRKEMKIVRNNFDDNNCKLNEYENILSVDKILLKNEKKKKKNKKFDWKKLIHQQEESNWKFLSCGSNILNNNNQNINFDNINNQRTHSAFVTPSFRNKKNMRNSNISILGILESAAKESNKGRYTYNV